MEFTVSSEFIRIGHDILCGVLGDDRQERFCFAVGNDLSNYAATLTTFVHTEDTLLISGYPVNIGYYSFTYDDWYGMREDDIIVDEGAMWCYIPENPKWAKK